MRKTYNFDIDETEVADARYREQEQDPEEVPSTEPPRRVDLLDEMADSLDAREAYLFHLMGR